MIYKKLYTTMFGKSVYAKIDNDGVSRLSCSEDDLNFNKWLAEGNEPLPADEPTNE